ncbi:MAG: asparagine synthase (glutamine-hydrolyzing) [Myxococcales bacterium]|nr:asparagine synthase (glutamine-hydrolyzing) [Myxococcales bacterium]MCB9716869.1 asparagine synthase (glutamine-hydrolyzing) [Myxococcales bacterium]
MCGITGSIGLADRSLLEAMTATLRHRGPDADGIAMGDSWGLGHRRLSIIDLEGGAQPMSSADGSCWLSYNGEIYNFRELRDELRRRGHQFATRSDTEVILAAYRQWGDAMLERLQGMFAFGLWDASARRLLLARDRVGIKPLYYAIVPGPRGPALAFGSEPKALLPVPGVGRELDPVALDAYLDLYYVPPPLSMFAGIRQLPPGHRLVWQDGRATVERWWDAEPRIVHGRSVEEWAEIVAPVLEDAIASRTVADVPLGAFLSGGLDSSTIVAVLSERGHGPVETFCVGYGEEGRSYDERSEARLVADAFGTRHHELELSIDVLSGLEAMVRGFDEPFGSPTAMLSSALSRFVRQHVTVALAGDGGDELFGGYPRYRGLRISALAGRVPPPLRALAQRVAEGREHSTARSYRRWARQFLAGLRLPDAERYAAWVAYARPPERDRLLSASLRRRLDEAGRVDPVVEHFARPARADLVERAAYADLHGFLPENVLRGSDRMSMAHGLELRVPFCDHRLVELAMRIPEHQRVGWLASKRVLRRIMRGRLPPHVLRRRKLGFNAPLGAWMRRDLDRLVDQWLAPSLLRARDLLSADEVARLVDEHRQGRRDHGLRLWSLIVLEQWMRLYLD